MFSLGAGAAEMTAKTRRAGELLLLLLENRLELASLELREEKRELVRVIVRAMLAVQLSLLALVLACVSIVWLAPPAHRGVVLLICTLVTALLALAAALGLTRSIRRMGRPMKRVIEEFRRDRELL